MNRTLQLAAGSIRSTTSGSSTHGRPSNMITLPPNIQLVSGSLQQPHEHERPARSRTLTLDTASLMTETTQLGESWPQKRRQRQSQV